MRITADGAATNGLTTVTYDASKLTLLQKSGKAEYNSFASADGSLTFGYAYKTGAPADTVLATLTFQIKESTDLTITTKEDGDQQPGTTETISLSACPSKGFRDLDTNRWYHEYTDYVIGNQLMNGMGDGLFAPNATLTRGMLVTTLYRLAGEPAVKEAANFTDVEPNRYYSQAIAWAEDNGIAQGMGGGKFAPNAPVTREQTTTFLYRYVTEYRKQTPAKGADLTQYTDAGAISPFAKTAMAWATAAGFLQGYGDGTVGPQNTATRAQMAKFLTILDQKF